MGLEELANDPRYINNEKRGDNYETGLKDALEAVTKTMSKFDIEDKLREARLACGAVYTVKEAMQTEHVKEREMLVEVEDKKLGKIKVPGLVIKMEGTPGQITTPAPLLGEHTEQYLNKIGYSADQIKGLQESSIIELA